MCREKKTMNPKIDEAVAEAVGYDGEMLPPKIVAPILGMSQQTYRVLARVHPEGFTFPIIVAGTRVRTPKRPFLTAMGIK